MLPECAKQCLTPAQIAAIENHPLAAQLCAVNLDVMTGIAKADFSNNTRLQISPAGKIEIIYEWRTYQEMRRMSAAIEGMTTPVQEIKAAVAELNATIEGVATTMQAIHAAAADVRQTVGQLGTLVMTHMLTWADEGRRPLPGRQNIIQRHSLVYNIAGDPGDHDGQVDHIYAQSEALGE